MSADDRSEKPLTIAALIALLQAEPDHDRRVLCAAEAGQIRPPVTGIYTSDADVLVLDASS